MAPSVPASLAVGRYKQLPLRSADVWQGGLIKLPAWVESPNDPSKPYRPPGAMWVSLRTGRVHLDLMREGAQDSTTLVLDVLLEFAKQETRGGAGRPGRLEVRGTELRDALDAALVGTGTSVVAVDTVPALTEALRSLEAAQAGGEVPPGLLETKGIGVDRARAFADSALRFYNARPWRHLVNEDLIVVESPKVAKGMACVSVLGNGGQQFGLAFLESRKAFQRLLDLRHPSSVAHAYGMTFSTVDELPFADVDAWEEHALPLAGPSAYPFPADIRHDGRVTRPSPKALTHMEGLLRVLAESTEEDFDSGRWHREVPTFDGPVSFTLSLPGILEAETAAARPKLPFPMRGAERAIAQVQRALSGLEFESLDEANAALENLQGQGLLDADALAEASGPLSALQQAQEIVYDAEDAVGRRRIILAKRALATSPDCADAYRLIAESRSTPEESLEWFAQGVEAGRRAIGDEAFESLAGHFWGHLETRPYMRARLGLAMTLRDAGRAREAIDHLQQLLVLNPGDNQGVRYLLLPILLGENEGAEAKRLLGVYEDDASATWLFGRALCLFRARDNPADARRALLAAHRANPHVAGFLLDPDDMPYRTSPYITMGGEDEAIETAEALLEAFEMTAGALAWLAQHTMEPRASLRRGVGRRGTRRPKRERAKRR